MKPLFKTTIVIWSEEDPTNKMELSDLAREAESGDSYCSKYRAERVEDPEKDPDWDGTEFFGVEPLTEEEAQCIDAECPDAEEMPYHDHADREGNDVGD